MLPVRVCSLSLPPQTMQDKDGNPDGFAVHILQAVAKQLNWKLDYSYFPWMRVVLKAKRGKCDLMMTVLKRDDYKQFMAFPKESVINQKNVLIVRHDSEIQYSGDLEVFMRKYVIGLYMDKAVDENFEKIRKAPWAKIVTVAQPVQVIKMLIAGRFDAAIENHLTSVYYLKGIGGLDSVEILSPPLNITPAYITFPLAGRLSEKNIAEFDSAMVDFKKTDNYQKLKNSYLGK